jgi:hypothetical protein
MLASLPKTASKVAVGVARVPFELLGMWMPLPSLDRRHQAHQRKDSTTQPTGVLGPEIRTPLSAIPAGTEEVEDLLAGWDRAARALENPQ